MFGFQATKHRGKLCQVPDLWIHVSNLKSARNRDDWDSDDRDAAAGNHRNCTEVAFRVLRRLQFCPIRGRRFKFPALRFHRATAGLRKFLPEVSDSG